MVRILSSIVCTAPDNIRRDDRYGLSYVFKQPENDEEVAAVTEGVVGCPTLAVRADGDQHDWNSDPIIDWVALLRRFDHEASFDVTVPVISHEDTLEEEERLAMKKWKDANKKPWWKGLFP